MIPTGSVIGILGGGQLGRMTAMAAARLGYPVHIYCPGADEPALQVAAFHTQGAFDDEEALRRFASSVAVITLEWENIPLSAIHAVEPYAPVCPKASVLKIAQDRRLEKSFARQHGVGTADFAAIETAEDLAMALDEFPLPAIIKSARMGYDGKGQAVIRKIEEAEVAWEAMGRVPAVLEAFVDFEGEVSVIVARRGDGVMASYPPVRNTHRNQILFETHAPSGFSAAIEAEAVALAEKMAAELGVVGLLAVEMFVLRKPNAKGQRVVMN